jgi:hypothetical protein
MKKNLISFLLFIAFLSLSHISSAQTEEPAKEQQDVGEHNDSQLQESGVVKKGKKKKGKKNLDELVEGKTQEDLEESNKTPLTKEEKAYLKKKEKKKKEQKKIDEATRKRTEKRIATRQNKAKKKVKKSKKTYLDTH